MALSLQSYFRETALGLRRNGIVAFAAMSTAFIALFLFGLALLIAREFNLVIEAWTGNVEVAVYLTDPVNPNTVKLLTNKLDAEKTVDYAAKRGAPAVEGYPRSTTRRESRASRRGSPSRAGSTGSSPSTAPSRRRGARMCGGTRR